MPRRSCPRPLLSIVPLLTLLALSLPAPARANEVWAESIIDQASALRDASAKVPSGAKVLSSSCSEVALPGLSYRYRCSVRFEPRSASSSGAAGAAPASAP
ncbi:MAG: hypothetical protein VKN15_03505 [Cyanobacteriota bacterium]|nr:hypothetical protein [Cyanobacteriota bacterium]